MRSSCFTLTVLGHMMYSCKHLKRCFLHVINSKLAGRRNIPRHLRAAITDCILHEINNREVLHADRIHNTAHYKHIVFKLTFANILPM
jgi:hypothetical protein